MITALVTALHLTGTVDSDVAWQLWIAGRLHAGAHLYRDIIETNPPLWFWMALPVDRLGAVLHLRVENVLIVAIGALVALSLVATNALLSHVRPARRTLLLGYAALALMAMPWMHVGQREQIVLIGTLPYAALIAARRERKNMHPLLAGLIGAGAALGFALKHYFLIVPGLLELWLVVGQRRSWRPFRPETIALITVGGAYAAAILLLAPDFLTRIVPLIQLAYGDFGPPSVRYLFGMSAFVGMAMIAVLAAHSRLLAGRKAPLAAALFVCALGFAAIYFIQFKGWAYHAIPLLGCASVGIAALLAESETPPATLRIIAPALLSLPLVLAAEEQRHPMLPSPDLLAAVSGLDRRDTVGFLTTETAIPWSVTLQSGYRYASRYNGFWMIPAIIRNEHLRSPDARLAALGRQIVAQTATDFRCLPPRRIIVARPQPGTWSEHMIDVLPFFARDPQFAEIMTHYRPLGRSSLDVYELKEPMVPLPASQCRHGV